jgi:hypothetical protein
LAEYNEHINHYFFNKFKMNLYQQGVSIQLWKLQIPNVAGL